MVEVLSFFFFCCCSRMAKNHRRVEHTRRGCTRVCYREEQRHNCIGKTTTFVPLTSFLWPYKVIATRWGPSSLQRCYRIWEKGEGDHTDGVRHSQLLSICLYFLCYAIFDRMIKAPARCPGRRALLLRVHLSPMVKFKHNWAMIATAGQTIFLPRGNMEKRKLATPCLLFVGRLMVGKVSHPCLKPYKEMVDATAEKIESISRCFSIIQLN